MINRFQIFIFASIFIEIIAFSWKIFKKFFFVKLIYLISTTIEPDDLSMIRVQFFFATEFGIEYRPVCFAWSVVVGIARDLKKGPFLSFLASFLPPLLFMPNPVDLS